MLTAKFWALLPVLPSRIMNVGEWNTKHGYPHFLSRVSPMVENSGADTHSLFLARQNLTENIQALSPVCPLPGHHEDLEIRVLTLVLPSLYNRS